MLEEMLLMAVRWGVAGGSIAGVADMDVISFSFLVELISRIELREKYLDAWTNMVSSQGTHKGMSKWTKPWMDSLRGDGSTPSSPGNPPDDTDRFKTNFGKGI